MNRDLIHAAAALAALAALAAPAVHAEGGFTANVHARAFEAAQQGPEALRTFISRTRMIHALNYADYERALPNAEIINTFADTAGYDLQPEPAAPAPDERSPEQRAADELREQILRDLSHE